MSIFYPALIVMSRDADGNPKSVRPTATRFINDEAAKERYGNDFIRLLEVECDDSIPFYSPIEA